MSIPTLAARGRDGLVSIIIPCHNHGHFLTDAVTSVLTQIYDSKEVIVVDDGSTDATREIAARLPVKYVYQENRGVSAARNRGLAEGTGAFVVFLDADDLIVPGGLAAGVADLQSHPNCAFVFGSYFHIGEDGAPLPMKWPAPDLPGSYLTLLRYNHIGSLGTVMFRRSVFDAVGGFQRRFSPAEDYELYLRVARQFPIHRHDSRVSAYRKYGKSVSDDPVRMLDAVLAVLRAQVPHASLQPDHAAALREGIEGNRKHYVELIRMEHDRSSGVSASRRLRLRTALFRWDRSAFAKAVMPGVYAAASRWMNAVFKNDARMRQQRGPLRALELHPHETPRGVAFNKQPNGNAALAVRCANADSGTSIVFRGVGLPSVCEQADLVTAAIPSELYGFTGAFDVFLRDETGRTSEPLRFTVLDDGSGSPDEAAVERRMGAQPRIRILILHFGSWPEWLPLFLETCRSNPTIDWLILTDCGRPADLPPNVQVEASSLPEITQRIARSLGFEVPIETAYKLCDLRLAFPRIFADLAHGYDFLGWGDLDVLYGDMRRLLSAEAFENDVVAFYDQHLSGHLTLVRNCEATRDLHLQVPDWERKVRSPAYQHLDEPSPVVVRARFPVWARQSYNTPFSPYAPWRDGTFNFPTEWYWRDGKLTNDLDGPTEFLYLHFMHWKGGPWPRACGNAQWERLDRLVHFDPALASRGFRVNADGFFLLEDPGPAQSPR